MVRRAGQYIRAKEEKRRPWKSRSLEVSQDIRRTGLQQRGDLRRWEGVSPVKADVLHVILGSERKACHMFQRRS